MTLVSQRSNFCHWPVDSVMVAVSMVVVGDPTNREGSDMSEQERRELVVTMAGALLSGMVSTYQAFAAFADDETIIRALVLFRARRASWS